MLSWRRSRCHGHRGQPSRPAPARAHCACLCARWPWPKRGARTKSRALAALPLRRGARRPSSLTCVKRSRRVAMAFSPRRLISSAWQPCLAIWRIKTVCVLPLVPLPVLVWLRLACRRRPVQRAHTVSAQTWKTPAGPQNCGVSGGCCGRTPSR